jgi:ribonuclease Z
MLFSIPGFGNVDIQSVAGCSTRVVVPHYNACFDMGEADEASIRAKHVFLSHTHQDHMSGTWKHAAIRHMRGLDEAEYVVPYEFRDAFGRYHEAFQELDGAPTPMQVRYTDAGTVLDKGHVTVMPFRTVHRIPSYGYAARSTRMKLKTEYRNRPGPELAEMRRQGLEIEEPLYRTEFVYTGDTTIDVLYGRHADWIKTARVLVMEMTCVGSVDRKVVRERGHIHIDDIADHADWFENQTIILMHVSARHTRQEVLEEYERKLPASLLARCRVEVACDQLKER